MCQNTAVSESITPGNLSQKVRDLLPQHAAAQAALKLAESQLPTTILYHSIRVYFYANAFMTSPLPPNAPATTKYIELVLVEPHVLFVACILHDIATTEQYDGVLERFEVTGADMAARLLEEHGEPETAIRATWFGVALHTTPDVLERWYGAVGALRLGILAEFGAREPPVDEEIVSMIQRDLPRLDIEKELGDAVVRQALKTKDKAPVVSWTGHMLRSKEENPEWDGANKAFGVCA